MFTWLKAKEDYTDDTKDSRFYSVPGQRQSKGNTVTVVITYLVNGQPNYPVISATITNEY
ncbi:MULTISPECIES: hypothetical protein [unclassified Paenibacillus]|uniref:hypothetical protein n=1 Tax=unclassified Paenibacillus TaxID=185978 RepID=UPI00240600AB|nr:MULTISPECIES: hypothetical protein [unclassified Paenibacillus]MDF9844558.1 hypothetical protein [Paenibacillus sp. PastF-2]MDF9851157.1 hypothetical protein [Paenibacillus sp. PastM-2]MDF9856208.1 hypothetical protein [Paenibacillus sp. PastF-1]MDH6481563.1 hypothetical protein [Paenibacillus sp. PastH-2]